MTDDNPFTPDVVATIKRHMNDDHSGDSVLICRALGGQPDATGAEMVDMDSRGIDFVAEVGGAKLPVRIPWSEELSERAQVRLEVVRMYHEACAALGIEPRAAEGQPAH